MTNQYTKTQIQFYFLLALLCGLTLNLSLHCKDCLTTDCIGTVSWSCDKIGKYVMQENMDYCVSQHSLFLFWLYCSTHNVEFRCCHNVRVGIGKACLSLFKAQPHKHNSCNRGYISLCDRSTQ